MLNLPVYLRGQTYYLHTRILGKQVKRSLNTSDKLEAMLAASNILKAVLMAVDLSKVKKYELDLSRGIAKADGPDDHQRMLEAIAMLSGGKKTTPPTPQGESLRSAPAEAPTGSAVKGLKLLEVLDKFFLLRKVKPATVETYKNAVSEFSTYLKNPVIGAVMISDVTRWQEHLATKKNSLRTVDNKIGCIRALFNFAIKQGYYHEAKNPAADRIIISKREKIKSGYQIFELQELQKIFSVDFPTDPDYTMCRMLGLFTGCRISEITSLTKKQFYTSPHGVLYFKILDSKTAAGMREVPVPEWIGLGSYIEGKEDRLFKYKDRLDKGSGNAVSQKFKRQMADLKISREKLVFHSLRKFLNDYMLKHDVPFEARCQFVGHEIDNVNVQSYSKKFSVDQLAELIFPVLEQLKKDITPRKTKFD